MDPPGPASYNFFSQRLRLHYVDWGSPGRPLVVLVHGGEDHSRNWDRVAQPLRADYHVVCPDLRGHGDSAWAVGSGYGVAEHVLDLSKLLDQLADFPVVLVGHSFGGAIALQYAGVYPDNVRCVVSIEGLGPPPDLVAERRTRPASERIAEWIDVQKAMAARQPRRYPDLDSATARMQAANPYLRPEQARHLTAHGTVRNEDGTYSWKFDNYVRSMGPHEWDIDEAKEIWSRITCPVLLVWGTERSYGWNNDPGADGRLEAFADVRLERVPGAGHWVHHDRLDDTLRLVRPFLAAAL